jgi:hypothetical protein
MTGCYCPGLGGHSESASWPMSGDRIDSMLNGPSRKGLPMKQIRISKPRRRVTELPEPLPWDARDPEILRAKQLAAHRRETTACPR